MSLPQSLPRPVTNTRGMTSSPAAAATTTALGHMVPPARVIQPQPQPQLQRPVPKPPTRYVVPLAGGAQEGQDSVAAVAAFTSKDVQKSFNNNYQRYVDNIIDSLEHGNACTAALAFERVHKKKLVPEANGSGLLLSSKGGKADSQSGDGGGDEQQASPSPMALMKESILKMDSAIEMLSRKIAIDLYKPLTKRLLEEAKLPFDNQAITLASNLIAQYIIDLVVSTRSLKKRGGGTTPPDASPIKITRKDFDGFLPYISCLARLPEGVTVPIFHNYKKKRNAATSKNPRKRPLTAQEGGDEQDAQQKKNRIGRPSKKFKMESPPSFREEE